ncbi:hypothetical protein D3C72_2433760 [compost metagenome]
MLAALIIFSSSKNKDVTSPITVLLKWYVLRKRIKNIALKYFASSRKCLIGKITADYQQQH